MLYWLHTSKLNINKCVKYIWEQINTSDTLEAQWDLWATGDIWVLKTDWTAVQYYVPLIPHFTVSAERGWLHASGPEGMSNLQRARNQLACRPVLLPKDV